MKGKIIFELFLLVSKSQYFLPISNSDFSNVLDLRNLQEQAKKHSVTKHHSETVGQNNFGNKIALVHKSTNE